MNKVVSHSDMQNSSTKAAKPDVLPGIKVYYLS